MIEMLGIVALIGLAAILAYAAAFFVFMLAISAYTRTWKALELATLPGGLRAARASLGRHPRKASS